MKIMRFSVISFIVSIVLTVLLFITGYLNLTFTLLFLLLFLVIYSHGFYMYRKFKKDYEKMNETIEEIINENLSARMISKFVSFRKLNANLNRLAKKIEKMALKKDEDELTIKILSNNITSPIVYIDRDGRIRYVNHQFLNCFEVNVEINDIYEKLRIKKLYRFIDDAFIFETEKTGTITVHDKYYQANAIPINNKTSDLFNFIGILFIFHDITELKRYETLQREFLADASHELKTPLSAIKGASEILLNGVNHSKETINEFLTIIKTENERMERIVHDILLISRIENEKVLNHIEEIDLNQLLQEVIKIHKFRLEQKNQNLLLDLQADLYISGDRERLKHVFLNLLSNSIGYTNPSKSIYLKTSETKDEVIVSLRDEGIGIESTALPHIFERFYRVDKARSRETGGTGLGLAIVKSTLDSHKAKIEVKSTMNVGTEFMIHFKKTK